MEIGTYLDLCSIKDMTKNELIIAIALITILLISVLWKEELYYRARLSRVEINIDKWEKEIQDSLIWENNLDVINSTSEPKKKKPNPKAWLEKYGKHLHPQSNS